MNFSEMIKGVGIQSINHPYEVYTVDGLVLETQSRREAFAMFLDYRDNNIWAKVICGTEELCTTTK